MPIALVHSRALLGMTAPAVTVEAHLSNGLPAFSVVGLPETSVRESRERVRAALLQAGFDFPNRRITVNLAPADLPKGSGRFDLPIALGILAASGQLPAEALAKVECVGELSLTGELRPVRGALALALAVARDGGRRLMLPAADAAEAARVQDVTLVPVPSLRGAVHALGGELPDGPSPEEVLTVRVEPPAPATEDASGPDLADVRGHTVARRALEIAAAGGHHLLMTGGPGVGKSMLAQRLPGLLPAMTEDEALESAALQGLTGRFDAERWGRRPFRAPHHSASGVALVGGGTPIRPGEASLAHGGVLFLDEFAEFDRRALDMLREPLETGWVQIARAGRHATWPARFQLVAAMNPCPCGHAGTPACTCTPDGIARHRARVSGPMLDRVDLHVDVPAQPAEVLLGAPSESTACVRARVAAARGRMLARQGRANHALDASGVAAHCALDAAGRKLAEQASARMDLSSRALHRLLRVARTIADLAGKADVDTASLAEALTFRPAARRPG